MGDKLEFEGEVINSSKGIFNVKVNDNYVVLCTLSGKIRQNSVNILVGDTVRIEVSEYDTTRGRITYRVKK
jgi:translation initiation factor IF-1